MPRSLTQISGSPQQGHGPASSPLQWLSWVSASVHGHACTCVFCSVCKLKEWKLARVFIDYIEHWAQSQKASSFKFSNTVTASMLQRWCEPHYAAKLWTMREREPCALEIFFFSPSKQRLRRVISPSSFLAAGSAKANHPIWPSGETQSAHTERLDFKGALSNCLYHMWLPNAFRWFLIWLRITIILLSVLCSLSPTHCSGFQSDQNQSNGSLLLKQVWCRAKCLARNGKEAETTAGTSFREPYYTFFSWAERRNKG